MEQQNTNSKERALLPEGDDRIQAEEKNIPSKKISHFIYNGSSAYLSLILISSIFVGETLVELFIDTLPPFSQLGTALLDSTLLIVPVFPILYFFVFRPLTIHITERKQTEVALKNSMSLTDATFESIHNAILVVSDQGTVIKTNAKFAEMWRIPDNIIASGDDKTLMDSVLGQLADPDGFIAKVLELYEKPEAESLDLIDLKDGRIFERISKPIYLGGEPKGRVWSFLNITKRKQAEETLVQEQYLMRTLMDNLPDHIYFKDHESRFIRINKAHAQMFGLSDPMHAVGKTDFDFFTEEHAQQAYEDEQTIIRTGQMLSIEEKETQHDRPNTWVSTIKLPLRDKEGNIIGTFGISRDITERKQVEKEIKFKNEELQKINAEKDKFFSIIAHDLRSPFNGFLGLTQIMVQELPDLTSDEIQKIAVSMRDSATNLFRLLENLLEWARMQQGLIPFDPKIVELLPIVDECISIMLEPAKNKGIELSYDIPVDIAVFADSNLLQTVIRNLVSNALKFTPKGGKVSFSAKATNDNSVEISIKDSGIGMNQTMVNNLFRLDVKTNRLGTEGEPSSGLGLLLCKEFIEKHGGKLWVESEDGKGSTFYFTIPCKTENEAKTVI